MKTYTAFEYLCIDLANNFGHDKWEFETRIQWVFDHMDNLWDLVDHPDADKKTKALLKKSILTIERARKGIAIGHMVGMDATCSGMQILSCVTGCVAGAHATGLVDPNKRMDAYKEVTNAMNEIEGILVKVPRQSAKEAVMTSIYGSTAKPKEIFGEESPELNAFYLAMNKVCPGAWEVLEELRNAWTPWAKVHAWKLPDGFDARVKVMEKVEKRIEVDELDHATFTHEFYVNEGTKTGISLVANVTHSLDAYVLRTMQRRCSYNEEQVLEAMEAINWELSVRSAGYEQETVEDEKIAYFVEQYKRSTVADVVIVPYLNRKTVKGLDDAHLVKMQSILSQMLQHKPFHMYTVHDA